MPIWMIALIAYFTMGFALVFIGPAARELRREKRELELDARSYPRWKIRAFAVAIGTGVILLWPYLAVSAARSERRPTTAWDVLQSIPAFQEQQQLYKGLGSLCEEGVDADELPNGLGDFGLVSTNPIPCRTVFGSTAYLSGLRASDGTKVVYQRLASVSSEVSSFPVDAYEVSHLDGRKLATVFISPYQKRNSRKSPRGFALAAIKLG